MGNTAVLGYAQHDGLDVGFSRRGGRQGESEEEKKRPKAAHRTILSAAGPGTESAL
jgi:hypothetical protein